MVVTTFERKNVLNVLIEFPLQSFWFTDGNAIKTVDRGPLKTICLVESS